MRKMFIIYGLLTGALIWFMPLNVHAFTAPSMTFKMNGTTIGTQAGVYMAISQNINLTFSSDTLIPDISLVPNYGYVTFCSAVPNDIKSFNTSGTYTFQNVQIIQTQQLCVMPDSNYPGARRLLITYNTRGTGGQQGAFNCSVNGTNCTLAASAIYYWNTSSNVISLINYGWSDTPITYDSSSDTIVIQNDKIIQQNEEAEQTRKGLLATLQSVWSSITSLPSLIWNAIKSGFEAITGAIKGLFDFFTDASSPNIDINTGLLPEGPLDSIILLPISILESVRDQLGGSCKPIVLPLPFVNKTLDLPCVKTVFAQISGVNVLLNMVSTLAIFYILKAYLMRLYVITDEILSLEDKQKAAMKEWGDI